MKKITTILLALMLLTFASCKKQPVDNNTDTDADTRKVKVSCTIALNNGGRSDFGNLMETGKVNWSEGRECIYVAIPGSSPRILELEGWADGTPSMLEFEGEVAEGLITDGGEYDIWYFGHSQQLETPYVNLTNNKIEGNISNQSGRIEDLGYSHIAKTTVTATTVNGEVVLNLNGTLRNQIAIAMLDLEGVTELYGDAIAGTEYTLTYNTDTDRYELLVTEDNNAKISVESEVGISYVVLLPNETKETKVKCVKGENTYAYTFHNGIKANRIYYRTASDGVTKEALTWVEYEEEIPETPDTPAYNGHEYVDLGLPSGLKWATCNVGASKPEEYGYYFAWGETKTKAEYTYENSLTYGEQMSDISGYYRYDAATANWGGSWRMPTYDEMNELRNNCTWTWTTQDGVKGYKVTSKTNGNHIFLPAAGFRYGSSLSTAGSYGGYWSSTPYGSGGSIAYLLDFYSSDHYMSDYIRIIGQSVRPVSGGNFEGPAVQYAFVDTDEVSEITQNSAVSGGNVTTDNGSAVTAKGVCWSTSENPTIYNSKTNDGSGTGSFTSQLTNLEPNTTYYVRAYATNAGGTSYGEQKSFTTEAGNNIIDDHEYVDLGLPSGLKWATCNVGASSPEDYGNYYAWGETTTKDSYSLSNSQTYGLSVSSLQSQGYIDGEGNLTSSHDAATANWGGSWRMPTYDEMNELRNNCTWTWTTQDGVKGYKVTSKTNGNHIFLPAAGYRLGSSLYIAVSYGGYWSSTPYGSDSNDAYYLFFDSSNHLMDDCDRLIGQSVRPVTE